jgi:hypothetical protein
VGGACLIRRTSRKLGLSKTLPTLTSHSHANQVHLQQQRYGKKSTDDYRFALLET